MHLSKGLWAVAFGLVTGAALLAAPAGDSASATPPQRRPSVRLTRPWSQMTDLTDDEKKKILEIHGKAAEQIRQIQEQEHKDILALLTEDQKKEAAEIETRDREQRRSRRGTASSSGAPAATPSNSQGAK